MSHLEDGQLLDAARPITPKGEVRFDPVKVRAGRKAWFAGPWRFVPWP
jgi:hypothetical protein